MRFCERRGGSDAWLGQPSAREIPLLIIAETLLADRERPTPGRPLVRAGARFEKRVTIEREQQCQENAAWSTDPDLLGVGGRGVAPLSRWSWPVEAAGREVDQA